MRKKQGVHNHTSCQCLNCRFRSWWIVFGLLIVGLISFGTVLPGVWQEAFPPLPGDDPHFAFIHGIHALGSMYVQIPSGYLWMDDSSFNQINGNFQSLDSIARGLTAVQPASIEDFADVDDIGRIQYIWYVDRNSIVLFNLPDSCFVAADPVYRMIGRLPDMTPVVDTGQEIQFQVDCLRRLPTVAFQSVPYVIQTSDRGNRVAIGAFIDSVVTLYSGGVLDDASRATADTLKARANQSMDIVTEYVLDHRQVPWSNRIIGILTATFSLLCWWWIKRHQAAWSDFRQEYIQAHQIYLCGIPQYGLDLTHPATALRRFFRQRDVHNFFNWYRLILDGEIASKKRQAQEAQLYAQMEEEYAQEVLLFRKQLDTFFDADVPGNIIDVLVQAERGDLSLTNRQAFFREAQRLFRLHQEAVNEAAQRAEQERSDIELERNILAINLDDLAPEVRYAFLNYLRDAEAARGRPAKRRYYLMQAQACISTRSDDCTLVNTEHPAVSSVNHVADASVIHSVGELDSLIDFNGLLPSSVDRSHVIWIILAFINPTGGIPYVKHAYTHLENIRRDVRNKIEAYSDESFQVAFEWLLDHQVILLYKRTRTKEGYSFNTRAKEADEIGRPIIERVVSFMHQVKIRTQ